MHLLNNIKYPLKLTCLFSILLINACQAGSISQPAGIFRGMRDGAPEGTEIFRAGWKDGCETGIAANTNDFYKLFAKIKQNPKYMKEEVYRRVWQAPSSRNTACAAEPLLWYYQT